MGQSKVEKTIEQGKDKLQEGAEKAEKMIKKILPKK